MPARSKASLESILSAFYLDETAKSVAKRLGVSLNRLRPIWKEHFGDEAYQVRSRRFQKGAPEGALEKALKAFHTSEPFKKVAKRLGMSPNTLRDLWKEEFGGEAFHDRGRELQQKGAVAFGIRSGGLKKARNFVDVLCEGCSIPVRVTKHQKARSTRVLCDSCRGLDRKCPVCGLACQGVRGLASHLKRAQDKEHHQYVTETEEAKWGGLEERDFVVCQECGLRGLSLTNHIKIHGLTAEQYRNKYPSAVVSSSVSETKRIASLDESASKRAYGWGREDLQRFQDETGRVVVAEAALSFGASPLTVLGYCRSLGLPTRNKLAWQKVVLDQAARAFEASYEWEWSDDRIRNLETGRVFNYDGYFDKFNLIVEAHGDQHFRYSESWHGSLEQFHKLRERDALKRRLAEDLGYRVIVVRPTDPTQDPVFWHRALENGQSDVSSDDISMVFHRLRKHRFPVITPAEVELKKALKRLSRLESYVDSHMVLHPYSIAGTAACASYFPSRYHARHKAAQQSAYDAWHDDKMLRKAIELQVSSGHPTTPERVLRALVMFCRTPSVFRPAVAKYVYQTYARGGVVWDPCMGYGGRLLGAFSAGVSRYIGTDVEAEIVQGNVKIAEHLGVASQCRVVQCLAEIFDPGVELDLVFTSPPYSDLEIYGKGSVNYASSVDWVEKFLKPVMQTASKRLKLGGCLVLNLPHKPQKGVRLDLEALVIGRTMPFLEENACWMPVRGLKGRKKGEPILVWRKCQV